MAFSPEEIPTILNCNVSDLTLDIIPDYLQDLYIFIQDSLQLIETGYKPVRENTIKRKYPQECHQFSPLNSSKCDRDEENHKAQ